MWQNLPQSQKHLFLIYTCAMLVLTAIPLMVFSENFKAAWIYRALPIREPGEVLSGALKAMIVKFLMPVYLLLSIGILAIWGLAKLDDLILGLVNNLFFSILVAWIYAKSLPFSRKPLVADTSGRSVRTFLSMLVFAAVGFGHYLIINHQWAIWTAVVVISIANLFLFNRYRKLTWKQIQME